MRVSILQQPFGPDGTPQSMGAALEAELRRSSYNTLKMCVAFVTSTGTSRLYGPLKDFVSSGGRVEAYVGLANELTSMQAVQHLLQTGATVLGFDTGGTVLFHPKVYLLQGAARAWAAVGSSNLTAEGLFRNFETNVLIELDLTDAAEATLVTELAYWFSKLQGYSGNCYQLQAAGLEALVRSGTLVDERARPQPQRLPISRAARLAASPMRPRIWVPSAPPPHPALGGARTRVPRPTRARAPTRGRPAPTAGSAQYFAMTLSAFDCSHRSGVKGTPEVSLPEDAVRFFPSVSMQERRYPDAYFYTLLNDPNGTAKVVRYRLWQRPPGSRTGHADWRINVKHSTIDLTSPGGGDILLFERLPPGSDPQYEVWVVGPTNPNYASLRERCARQVQASGRAGTKHYGLF